MLRSFEELVGATLALGARSVSGWDPREDELARIAVAVDGSELKALRVSIHAGADPLGEAFTALRSADLRRVNGQTYTPTAVIDSMVAWAASEPLATRVVDPGVGSARYLAAAGKALPNADLVGIDIDPMATLMARANLSVLEMSSRSRIELGDFRSMRLPVVTGPTLYIGNPPYVRHHNIEQSWKEWLSDVARRHGMRASQLAGLHVHFFAAVLDQARAGDRGTLVTSAEWLDTNYGKFVRDLLLSKFGGTGIHVLEPEVEVFPGTATTTAITTFEVGEIRETIRLERLGSVADLGALAGGLDVGRQRLQESDRWSVLTRPLVEKRQGFVELGELCRVHRGAVTGANDIWIGYAHNLGLPAHVLFPSVTRARELFAAGTELTSASSLKVVVDLPADLSTLSDADRRRVAKFLRNAERAGVKNGYVAQNRKNWWRVGLPAAAPILATYMARRAPAFVRNGAAARHVNIAHGLYPRDEMTDGQLEALATALRSSSSLVGGRTYAGGLTKFEPREMERLLIPEHLTDSV